MGIVALFLNFSCSLLSLNRCLALYVHIRDMILISAAPEHYFSDTAPQCVDSLTPPLHFQVNIKQSIGHGRGVDM